MGRRSVNTTKSGKYMNPTDQARKEARKKELKKNKKQRMAVRHAVLKAKDAPQLLEEASMYDKQEYDPNIQAALNERVLQEKRKRVLDTFDRLVVLYKKEDPEYASSLQMARTDYDKRRHEMMLYYEQVKLAERVKASEIPLPDLPPTQLGLIASEIPLPIGIPTSFSKSILKKSFGLPGLPPGVPPIGRKPPGPPPLPITYLSDSDSEEMQDSYRRKKIRFTDEANTTGIGEATYANRFSAMMPSQIPLPPTAGFQGLIRPNFHNAPQPRTILPNPGSAFLSAPPTRNLSHQADSGVNEDTEESNLASQGLSAMGTTIEAKPQLKNLMGDATRFVPTAVKVKRTVKDAQGRLMFVGGGATSVKKKTTITTGNMFDRNGFSDTLSAPNKDEAYDEFMREMETLL